MVSLTIQQRDLLHQLLTAEKPVVVADIANRMNLTPRQVSYRLKPLKVWLSQREATLRATPGIGITIDCPSEQRFNLLHELNSQANFQLILTPGQRQQLFAFTLLTTKEPLILDGLGYIASVSRTTVLKDLDVIEAWLQVFALTLIRRPNFGLFLEGPELAQRQALTSLLWEDVFFEDSLTKVTYDQGLIFSLSDNTALPIIKQTKAILKDWNTQAALEWVTYAEAQLGGRFTDNAVLQLALAFIIQRYRVAQDQRIQSNPKGLSWLVKQKVWPVALGMAHLGRMGATLTEEELLPEVAYIAMHLLVEIRETETKALVTVIEILSPINKRPSHDAYHDYQRQRYDIFRSAAHLLKIDLLRAGTRPPLAQPVPPAPYYVVLSRANRRPTVEVWPIQLADPLPILPIPLLEPDPDAPLTLSEAVGTVYERGAYGLEIDYSQPPPPPLSDEEAAWVDELLRQVPKR